MPNQRMVQAWRAGNWPAGMFFDRAHQTVFDHSGIGEDMKPHLEGGWHKMLGSPGQSAGVMVNGVSLELFVDW